MKQLLSVLLLISSLAQANIRTVTDGMIQQLKGAEKEDIEKIIKNYQDKVAVLANYGARIDVVGADGLTSLMKACQEGMYEIVKVLLDAGADPCATDNNGFTAMMHLITNWFKVESGKASYLVRTLPSVSIIEKVDVEECIDLLIEAGSDSFEYAVIKYSYLMQLRAEQEAEKNDIGVQGLLDKVKRKLDPKRIVSLLDYKIKLRRLRKEHHKRMSKLI